MRTKKYISKFGCCIFLYLSLCFIIIIKKILLSSSVRSNLTVENRDINNLFFISTSKLPIDNNYYQDDSVWMEDESEDDMREALANSPNVENSIQRIATVCERYNKTTIMDRTHFFYSPQHNILYCWIRKVGSTSFTKLFTDFRGLRVSENYYRQMGALVPKNNNELLNVIDDTQVFKFLAVRHPFERLVSFYRSRIEDNSQYTDQAWLFAQKIFYATRPHLFRSNNSTETTLERIFYKDRRLKLIPTFREFIIWLLQEPEEHDDPHWRQYHSHCPVCQMRLDYVFKLDNYSIHDINYIFSITGLTIKKWKLPKLGSNVKGSTNFARTCFYLSKLSENMLSKLFERYKIDFEMFDYNYDSYRLCAK